MDTWKPRRAKRHRKLFLLEELPSMRSYLSRLMADLRDCWVRRKHLERQLRALGKGDADYGTRRQRRDLGDQIDACRTEQRRVQREFRQLGVVLGDLVRGEMIFPCRIEDRPALFVWFDGEHLPSHWRFADERSLRAIPGKWFRLLGIEQGRRTRTEQPLF